MEEIFDRLKTKLEERKGQLSHANRVIERAMSFDEIIRADVDIVTLMILVHSFDDPKNIMESEGIDQSTIKLVMDHLSSTTSIESKIFHDAHYLEGDDIFFPIYQSLIQSERKGESLEDCARHNSALRRKHAYLSKNEREFSKREETFRNFFTGLSELISED